MSTRCEIAFKDTDRIIVIYQHFDGYLEGVGKELITDWNSAALAKDVINGKFNNEEEKYEYSSLDDWINHLNDSDREYAYLYDGEWKYNSCDKNWKWKNEWKSVKEYFK